MSKIKIIIIGCLTFGLGLLISVAPMTAQAKSKAVTSLPSRYYGTWYGYTGKSKLRKQKIYMVAKLKLRKTNQRRVTRANFGFYYSKSPKLTNIKPMGKIDAKVYLKLQQPKRHSKYYIMTPQVLTGFWWKVTSTKVSVHGKKVTALKLWQEDKHGDTFYMIRSKERSHSWHFTGFN